MKKIVHIGSLVVTGALLLSACGGADSRTRNAALGTLEQADCWVTQAAKNERLASLGQAIQELLAETSDVEALEDDYNSKAAAAKAAHDAMAKAEAEGASENTLRGLRQVVEYYYPLAGDAYDLWKAAQEKYDLAQSLIEQGRAASERPLCSDITPVTSVAAAPETSLDESPDTTIETATEDVTATALENCGAPVAIPSATSVAVGDEFTVTVPDCDGFQSVVGASGRVKFVTARTIVPGATDYVLAGVSPGLAGVTVAYSNDERDQRSPATVVEIEVLEATSTTSEPTPETTTTAVQAEPEVICASPVPRDGTAFTIVEGDTLILDFEPCEQAPKMSVELPVGWNGVDVRWSRPPDSTLTLTARSAGTFTFVISRVQNGGEAYGEQVRIAVTVREKGAVVPCAGLAPTGVWEADRDGGTFTATSTCEATDTVAAIIERVFDGGTDEIFTSLLTSSEPQRDLIQVFGSGTYRVRLWHFVQDDDLLMFAGDATLVDVVYEVPASEDGTVSNGALPTSRQGVAELPSAVFTVASPTAPENPRDTSLGVPVLALPSDVRIISCGTDCAAGIATQAGVENGTVEIAIGDEPWTTVTAASTFAAPLSPTAVKVRVTSDDGTKVEMAAVVTRESTQTAYSDAKSGNVEVSPAAGASTTGESNSFPWWIIAVVVALLAVGGYAERRRRAAKAESAS